jgi:hypothetical protein
MTALYCLVEILRLCCGRTGRVDPGRQSPRRDRVLFCPTPDDLELARILEWSTGDIGIFSVPIRDLWCHNPRAACFWLHGPRS